MATICREAVEEVFANENGVLTSSDVIDRIYAKYPHRPWKEVTIRDHLIGLSVNHSSSKHHPTARKHGFLFCVGRGRYRRWNPSEDGIWRVTKEGIRRVDSGREGKVVEETEEPESATADLSLSVERDLERTLLANLEQLEPGLRLYQDEGISGQQLDTGKVGRLDMLCIDQSSNLVVIELKAGNADDAVCGQILRYMGWVGEDLPDGGKRRVRGIIVANTFSDSLKYAARAMPGVTLKRYEVRFEFTDV